jgi:hypothetical protein
MASAKAAANVSCIFDAIFPILDQNLTHIFFPYRAPIRYYGLHWNETKTTGQ